MKPSRLGVWATLLFAVGTCGAMRGTAHFKLLLDGAKSLPAAAVPDSFRAGLAEAVVVKEGDLSTSKAVRTGKSGADRGWLIRVEIAIQSQQASDELAQRMNRDGFIRTLVGALSKAGFAVASNEIHVISGSFSFTRAKGVCAMASDCKKCSVVGSVRCAWCSSTGTCLNSDTGVCDGDRWDTRACAMDRASLAVDRMDDNKDENEPSDTSQLSALVGLIAVFSTALLLVSLYQKVQHHFSSFSSGSRVIDTSTFEEIEESLELAEFDANDEELAYSREESSSLLSLY